MRQSTEDMQAPEFLKDRYTQFELLGTGGMGVVYRAFDQTLQKDVAIKILPGQKPTPERAMRFQQEARTASKLKHPNLITILDFGISPTGEPFLVMDFAAGVTLDSIIEERGTIDAGSALEIVYQICEGMKHAHANGVVHRDLKPSNVIVEPDECSVKVVDFGIAKLTDEGKGLTITPQGRLIGTPSYMSPEQIAGEEVDARSDIYSIGCILFHLLAGRPPFESDTSIEVLQSARTKKAPSIQEVNRSASLPREVEELVAKSLLKDPSQRQSSVEELQDELCDAMEALEQFEKQRTASDGSKGSLDSPLYRGPRRKKNSPRALMIGAMFGIGTLVPVAAIIYMIMATPSVPDSGNSKSSDAMQWNAKVALRPTDAQAIEADKEKDKDPWKGHFKSKWQDGTERFEALDSLTIDDLKQMGDDKVKLFALNFAKTGTTLTLEHCRLISKINVEQLDLSNSAITDEDLQYIGEMTNLTKLEITSCANISDEGVAYLRGLKNLDTIQLSKTRITDKSIDVLTPLKRLRSLELFNTQVTDDGIAKLKALPIVEIGLEGCPRITDNALKPLAAKGKLTHVNVSETNISDNGLICLRSCKNLNTLRAGECRNITDAAVTFVADNLPHLHYLDVSGTKVSKRSIPTMLRLKDLHDLHIGFLELTDEDVAPLTSLSRVTKLDLSGNRVTDKSLRTLADMPGLESICFNHCAGTTTNGASYFQSAHKVRFGKDVEVELTPSDGVEKFGDLIGREETESDQEKGLIPEENKGILE